MFKFLNIYMRKILKKMIMNKRPVYKCFYYAVLQQKEMKKYRKHKIGIPN